MIGTTSRRIARIGIHETVRQVDAHEKSGWRYLVFYVGSVAIALWIWHAINSPDTTSADAGGIAIGSVIVWLVLIGVSKPWHTHLNVDLDTETCRVDLRAFGFLPFLRRHHEFAGLRFVTLRLWSRPVVGPATGTESNDGSLAESLGCLLFLLPFPFSLIWVLAGASKDKDAGRSTRTVQSCHVLALQGEDDTGCEVLLRLKNSSTADPLLRALHQLLPSQVILPAEDPDEIDDVSPHHG